MKYRRNPTSYNLDHIIWPFPVFETSGRQGQYLDGGRDQSTNWNLSNEVERHGVNE